MQSAGYHSKRGEELSASSFCLSYKIKVSLTEFLGESEGRIR